MTKNTKYIPEYERLGIKPVSAEFPKRNLDTSNFQESESFITKYPNQDNPRTRNLDTTITNKEPLIGIGKSKALNIGNNMDGSFIQDDIGLDNTYIDNNDQYSESAFSSELNNEFYDDISLNKKTNKEQLNSQENIKSNKSLFDFEGKYVVILYNKIIANGNLKEVESIVKELVFEEHPLSSKYEINIDDIIVLKRVNIKVGVFIEQE